MTDAQSRANPEYIQAAVERFEGPLVRYACRITGELELARDVVQEVFLRLCRQPPGEVDGHLAQWLYTVCRRRALDVRKKESRMKVSTDGVADALPDTAALATTARQEAVSQVLDLLDRLPPNQQEIVRLKFQAGLTYREISNVTSLSVSNVGYLLHTAVQTLRSQLLPTSTPAKPLTTSH